MNPYHDAPDTTYMEGDEWAEIRRRRDAQRIAMKGMSFREMFRAMQQGRGWLTDAEIMSRIADLQCGAEPDWGGELVELLRVIEARMQH